MIWQSNEKNLKHYDSCSLPVLFKIIKARKNLPSRNSFVHNSREVTKYIARFFIKLGQIKAALAPVTRFSYVRTRAEKFNFFKI
jgi:hypothetical protein